MWPEYLYLWKLNETLRIQENLELFRNKTFCLEEFTIILD